MEYQLRNARRLMKTELQHEGFIVVDNLGENIIDEVRGYFTKNYIDYDKLEKKLFVIVKNILSERLGWDARFSTFRCSNGLNLIGASGFHRDSMDYTSKAVSPVYSVLIYFDCANFEYIPGSHNTKYMSITQMIKSIRQSKRKSFKPGDIVLINSTLVHRGISVNPQEQRRFVLINGVIPSAEVERCYGKEIILVTNHEKNYDQGKYVAYFQSIFNFFYSIQQMAMINIPYTRNYVGKVRKNKHIIPYAMPFRQDDNNSENLYVLLNESNLKVLSK